MKKYTIILSCFCLLFFFGCKDEWEPELPPIGGPIYISIQNKEGENLLSNVETGSVNTGTIILRQNTYQLNCFINDISNSGLLQANQYLIIKVDLDTGDKVSLGFGYSILDYKMPEKGVLRYDFMCEDIFGDKQYYPITAEYTIGYPFSFKIDKFETTHENVTVELLNEDKGAYHILLTVDDSK